MFDGTPHAYLHVCGTPWSGNEYAPGQTAIWTMHYGTSLEPLCSTAEVPTESDAGLLLALSGHSSMSN
jgi:hypothetical protein